MLFVPRVPRIPWPGAGDMACPNGVGLMGAGDCIEGRRGPEIIGGGLGATGVHGDGGRYMNDDGDGEAGLCARGFQPRGPPKGGGC